MNRLTIIDKTGKKKLVNVPSWDTGYFVGASSNYADVAYSLAPLLYLDSGRTDSYAGSGTTWNNISGSSTYNGTLTGSVGYPTYLTSSGGVLDFASASGQWVRVNDLGSLPTFSVISWVNFDVVPQAGTNAIITNRYQAGDSYVNFTLGSFGLDNKIVGGFWNGAWRYPTGYTVSTNTWYNFAVTYDASTIRFYVNGSEYSNLSYAATVGTSTRGISIGKRWDSSIAGDFIDGKIPVAIVYNKLLTATNISDIYNQFKSRYT